MKLTRTTVPGTCMYVAAMAIAAATLGIAAATAHASGPFVFCNRSYPNYDTCVDSNPHYFTEVDALDLNGSNRVCSTIKNGPNPGSANLYYYKCHSGKSRLVNTYGLFGYGAAHNGENFSQIMEGQFYL